MGLKSIRIKNLLSYDDFFISDIKDINCIIGQNNVGKSNLLNLLSYFYSKMEGNQEIAPTLNSSYSTVGSITIGYDLSLLNKIVTSKQINSPYQKHIYNTFFKGELQGTAKDFPFLFNRNGKKKSAYFELTLNINKDESIDLHEDVIDFIAFIITAMYLKKCITRVKNYFVI